MEIKDAFKELARFAEARARGAAVVLGNGRRLDGTDGFTGLGVDANTFMSHTIKEIIEPKVLRDWTAEDARKHVGFAWRLGPKDSTPGLIPADSFHSGIRWDGREYAAPIPGTDPSKWDWKPCKVEVPASEPVKSSFDVLAAVRDLRSTFVSRSCDHARRAQDGLDQIIQQAESAK